MDENYYGISRLQFDKYFENFPIKYKNYIMDLLEILSNNKPDGYINVTYKFKDMEDIY